VIEIVWPDYDAIVMLCPHCNQGIQGCDLPRQIADALLGYPTECVCCDPETGNACPQCGSPNLAYGSYDCGCDSETGYADAGERYRCLDCGSTGDVDDAAPALVGSQSEALRLSRFARRFGALP